MKLVHHADTSCICKNELPAFACFDLDQHVLVVRQTFGLLFGNGIFGCPLARRVRAANGFSMCLLEAIDAGGEASGLTTNDAAKLMTEVADAKERLIEANDDMPLDVEFLGRADAEGNKLVSLRMRTARLLAFASLRLSDAFAAVSPDKKDLNQIQELLAVRTKSAMRLLGVCVVVVKAQAAKQE